MKTKDKDNNNIVKMVLWGIGINLFSISIMGMVNTPNENMLKEGFWVLVMMIGLAVNLLAVYLK